MKNLGSFNEESIALFKEHFEGSAGFAESTEEFLDFGRCQRPDGSFYGTSGQCRKGKEAGAKIDVEKAKSERKKVLDQANQISEKAEKEGRKLTPEEFEKTKRLGNKATELDMLIDKGLGGTQWKKYERATGKSLGGGASAAQEGGSGKSPTRLQQQKEVLKNFRAIDKAKIAARDSSTSEGVKAANKSQAEARSKAWNSLAQMKPEIKQAVKDWESGRAIIDNPKSTPEQRQAQWSKVNKAEAQIKQALEEFKSEMKSESAARKRK